MIQFDRSDAYDLGNVQVITKPLTGFFENFMAARENAKLNDQSQSRELILKDLWDPIVEELNDAFPGQAPVLAWRPRHLEDLPHR